MKHVPYAVIQEAKKYDIEAVGIVFRHFEGYIAKRSLSIYKDEYGNTYSFVDNDLRYQAEIALFSAIAGFRFREPPDDFAG